MKLEFIDIDKIDDSAVNMRHGKKAPDVADMLPTVRKRGIIVPVILRPGATDGRFELVAGRRRVHSARIVRAEDGADPDLGRVPSAIMEAGDDAAALEASLIENLARLDPDEVTQWETFTRLVKQGRDIDDIAATFGLPDLAIRRVLALGNLLPRIRDLHRQEKIDRSTVRHLTLASKSQQKAWLALLDDPDSYVPTGHQLKVWLFGGQSIPARFALFDLDGYAGATIADLFGDDRYFADADAFWDAQNAAIEARRTAYLDARWGDVVIVPPSENFHVWEYEKAPKRKGGRVYVDARASGEIIFHEGYVTRKEADRLARGEAPALGGKPQRPELTSTLQTYVDLHRHAAARAALLTHPPVALRLMVAHAIGGSALWTVRADPQSTRNDDVRESVEISRGEAVFDERRRAVLDLLGLSDEEPTVIQFRGGGSDVARLFERLLDLPDASVMDVVAIIMGEALAVGRASVDVVGAHIGVDMADWWDADEALFSLLRDREVLGRIVAEVAGETIAAANGGEKTKVLKQIVRDHLDGADGRTKVERWVPRWMRFPALAYTARGAVPSASIEAVVDPAPSPEAPESEPDSFAQAA